MAAFSAETLISDGDFVAGDKRAGGATEASAAGGGVGGGDAEAAEEEAGRVRIDIEADEADACFLPSSSSSWVMRMF